MRESTFMMLLRLRADYQEAEAHYRLYARIEDRLTRAERADKAKWFARSQRLYSRIRRIERGEHEED